MKMKQPHEKKQLTETKRKNKPSKNNSTDKITQSSSDHERVILLSSPSDVESKMDHLKNKANQLKSKANQVKSKATQSMSIANKKVNHYAKEVTRKIKDSEITQGNVINKLKQSIGSDYQSILRSKGFILTCVFLIMFVAVVGIGQQVMEAQSNHKLFLEENKAYKVFVDESYIGMVSDSQIIDSYIETKLTSIFNMWELETQLMNEVTYEEHYEVGVSIDDQFVLQMLQERLQFHTQAVVVYVNDNPVLTVASETDAIQVIENIKNAYVANKENSKVVMTEINDRIDYRVEWGKVNEIKDIESATVILLKGTDKEIKHVVESGENIWVIAQKNKVTVSEIVEANPQLKSQGDVIHPGDQLSLLVAEPIVNVESIIEVTEIEEIPFETRNVNDNKMYTWESRVQTKGQAGEREVVYKIKMVNGQEVERIVLQEKVLKEPVNQVVLKGTIGVPANGTGKLAWPTSGGKISSLYGGARRHSGVDIAAPTGTQVFAADSGTVVFAGWSGGYGNLIRIAHSSSMQTYYAHLSTINVKVGQAVKKGELIGGVGSTGQSTGPHLHFEVRINGGTVNPMNYYGTTR